MSSFNYNRAVKQYRSVYDIYKKFPALRDLKYKEIVRLSLDSHFKQEWELATACKALIMMVNKVANTK